jgi:hypothetical protein
MLAMWRRVGRFSRHHGRQRAHFYVCKNMRERGTCSNRAWLSLPAVDAAIISGVEGDLLTAPRLAAAVALARVQLGVQSADICATQAELETRIATLSAEIERLTAAVAQGAAVQSILGALRSREDERTQLEKRRREVARSQTSAPAENQLKSLTADVGRWRELLRTHIPQGRQILRKLLRTRILLKPEERDGVDGVSYRAKASLTGLLEGFIPSAVSVASPTGFEPVF